LLTKHSYKDTTNHNYICSISAGIRKFRILAERLTNEALSIQKIGFFFLKSLGIIFLLSLIALGLFYFTTTIYDFPITKAFSGKYWYNPYETCGESTVKANFHAHAVAWGKLTYGHNSDQQIFEGYQKKGYDIIGISNYHSISDYAKNKNDLYIPVYEHGWNLMKAHNLAINAKKVIYQDFPLFQTTSHQQKNIERLKSNGDIVAIAHPNLMGRSLADMRSLVNYDFMELLNHYRVSNVEYDEALRHGRLSWIISNDDTHDVRDETAFKIWNVIFTQHKNVDTILSNMKKGMHYGVKSKYGKCTNALKSCKLRNDSLFISFTNTVEHFDVHGGEEGLIDYQYNKKDFVYVFKPDDDFIRIVAKNLESEELFLNPIVRWDGKNMPYARNMSPSTNYPKTTIVRVTILLLILEIISLLVWLIKRKPVK
jgi:hypothetical protein